ncbi:aminoglycoside phosphotransferase, partial [mine drainage metagenome]
DICNSKHKPITLSEEDEILLKRAFWNCSSIDLVGKANGLSKVDAFDAFAHLARNVVGCGWPYRYFVKLGDRVKVAREFDKYRTTALENVPYHLGPRLRMDRCVLGRSRGLIVSDYVAGAEALGDCARDGRGIPAISNLFNQTLLAWRRAAVPEGRPLQEFLGERLRERPIIPKHREPLIRAYGATKTLDELKSMIEHAN